MNYANNLSPNNLLRPFNLLAGRCLAVPLAFLALVLASPAPAATIGLNFVRGPGGDVVGSGDGTANALAPGDTAGAFGFAQANWNNLGARGTNFNVLDSSGAASGVVVSWVSANTWSQAGGTPATQGSPDANLMNGYLDSNGSANTNLPANLYDTVNNANRNWPLVYFTGLSAWMASQGVAAYDVVIYSDGDDAGGARTGEFWTINASGSPTAMVYGSDQITHVFVNDKANFITTSAYQQVPPFVQSGMSAQFGNFYGNYTVLKGLTSDTFLVRNEEFNSRAPINGIQIIPRAAPVPADIAPLPDLPVLAGGTAKLRAIVAGRLPLTFQWKKNGVNLTDGGNISGATTATLTIANVTAADAATYTLAVTNPGGTATSTPSVLSLVTPVSGGYAEMIATNHPYAYWRFSETTDPATNYAAAYDSVGGFTGVYGNVAQNGLYGIAGPQPGDFPGFEVGNTALLALNSAQRAWVMAPPLNLNTNTVTFSAWIYPLAAQADDTELLFTRNGNDVAGFGYGDGNHLGYTWNSNSAATYNFPSGLIPMTNAWNFVATTISPTNAILYLYNANGQLSVTNPINHTNQALSGLTFIGGDVSFSATTPQNRCFNGMIDEVAVFNRTLAQSEIYALYKKGLGIVALPPAIPEQPQSLALFEGRTARFNVKASGDEPLSYQWRKNGVNLTDGGNISGANSPSLVISGATIASDQGDYDVVVQNIVGSLTSSPANLSLVVSNSAPTAYEAKLRELNPISYWRLNEANGSPYAYDYWGGIIAANDPADFFGLAGPTPPDYLGLEAENTAAYYDGFSGNTATSTGLLNNRPQFSVIGWFNTAGPIGLRIGLFGQNDVVEFGFHDQDPASPTGQGRAGLWTTAGSAFISQTNIIPGVWYLIAGVGTGTNVSIVLLSTNGGGGIHVVQATGAGSTTNYGVSSSPFRIGGGGILDTPEVNGNFFTGTIDEVAVFDRALSVGELSDLLGAAVSGGALAPVISSQSGSLTLYAGRTATFTVNAVASNPTYQWRKNGVPLTDGGNISGATTATLTITNVSSADQASYTLTIANSAGSVTSNPVTLTVITPDPGGYAAAVLAANPLAYYRLNETNDPLTGTVTANEYWGGHPGVYGVGAQNGFNGILGPRPPEFVFESNNLAAAFVPNTPSSYVTAPIGSLSTNRVTFTMWIEPLGAFDDFAGLLVNRGAGVEGGFGFTGNQLGYTWNNNSGDTWNYRSGLVPPLNEWSFVALVVEPDKATLYEFNAEGFLSATNILNHTSDVFGNNWRIGNDDSDGNNNSVRSFNGLIDEVAVFTYAMTPAQLQALYVAGGGVAPVTLNIASSGSNVVLTWSQGTLLQADSLSGPWTTNNAASPYTVPASGTQKFYRVIVK